MLAGASGESALGNLVADAQLWATREAGAQIAFMNPGGLRADLIRRHDGTLMFSDLFAVQPFSNTLVTVTLTGAQIRELLEQQFPGYRNAQSHARVLQVSRGFSYAWRGTAPAGHRISEARLDGRPLEPGARYRVTLNDYLVSGGDRFAVLRAGSDRRAGQTDVEALEAYVAAHSPLTPPALGRIKRLP
jgi:5'-nucleotidase